MSQSSNNQIHLSVKDILSQRIPMLNFRLPNDRTMYESSLIYCNLCDYSCDLTDKSLVISHFLSKHPDESIVYSYLWPQMEMIQSKYKIKYYLIKAHLKARSKDRSNIQSDVEFPNAILNESNNQDQTQDIESNVKFVINKIIDWIDENPVPIASSSILTQDDVQELEEEQEVLEVEMPGDEPYEFQGPDDSITDLVRLTSTAIYQKNQQKFQSNVPLNLAIDNTFLVHLLAINKIENVFRVKQIHDYLGACFICGKQVEFNMKHYQAHFCNEMVAHICLHCNYKEYQQIETGNPTNEINEPYYLDSGDSSNEEKCLQDHMTECHSIDFQQIFQQHQQLNSNQNSGVVVIESTPMNDMYLSINVKSIKYIDDELLRKDQFRTDMLYSCPICTGDMNKYTQQQQITNPHPYTQFENITFDYLINHFLLQHHFKAIPLFVCSECNCVRTSLNDCIFHYIRFHFNKKIQIGLCAFNIYDKIQSQMSQLQGDPVASNNLTKQHGKKSNPITSNLSLQYLPLAATTTNTIYGAGPLIYCGICNENYSNEQAFIRHSYLAHLLDPNINLNWFKVYVPVSQNNIPFNQNIENSLQQIAAAMAMADLNTNDATTISLVDANGLPINADTSLNLLYECPICFKSVPSKESINRHLLYHALNDNFEYDITCTTCSKQLSPIQNLAECMLHSREFKGHRLNINFSKYVLTSLDSGQTLPMVSCVLCSNESKNLLASISHILMDHFAYDSGVIKFKRFVNTFLKSEGLLYLPVPKTKNKKTDLNQINSELAEYFNSHFPNLINELIVSVLTAAQNDSAKISTNRPDSFFSEIKCFKCSKFSTKVKGSLFQHLNQIHGYDIAHMEKLFDLHLQKQLQIIDHENSIEKYEKSLRMIVEQQFSLIKESKEKSVAQYESIKEQQKILIQQQVSNVPMPQNESVDTVNQLNESENLAISIDQSQDILVQVPQPNILIQSNTNNLQAQTVPKPNKKEISSASSDKIDSTIDQVLSQICKNQYEKSGTTTEIFSDHSQQITVHAQPPEAENLFVFKCNLCEPYTTDDATQLLDHYKINHQIELTIADSSTLLAAAVAAFQTGHTIEMTGAILNTISSVTDENGLTIISGEEVPVHTTVQYKCTICQMIFYEKQFIVQHLYEAHNFEIDVSYFEEIELQQQEQLQQKIYEQQQEQLMLQQQQQSAEQNQNISQQINQTENQNSSELHPSTALVPSVQVNSQTSSNNGQISSNPTSGTDSIHQASITNTSSNSNMNADETAAVMMMMMNGGLANQNQPILLQTDSGLQTAQIVINPSQLSNLESNSVTLPGTAILTTAIPAIPIDSSAIVHSQSNKPTIAYNCSYCSFGADKLKKMSDHLKINHPSREKTCMDNLRNQVIRLPNEDLPSYNQNPTTVASLLQQKQLQSQTNNILNTSNSSSTASNVNINEQKQISQFQSSSNTIPSLMHSSTGRKRGPKPKTTSTQRPQTVASTLSRQQQYQQQMAQQHPGIKTPTILTMDANSQIIIDFNQNDDLLCSYCDYTMNNLNYMRTHIKYKHRNMPITFQNKLTYRFYTIVEWPLTPVPTLTPAGSTITTTDTSSSVSQNQQSNNAVQSINSSVKNSSYSSGNSASVSFENDSDLHSKSSVANTENIFQSNNTESSLNESGLISIQSNSNILRTKISKDFKDSKPLSTPGTININNVNSILKKLGVNKNITPANITVSTGQANSTSPLTSIIGSISSGKTVNNSVVNVNLNVLKDVNIDEMIDDDDDEERKFLIRELEKKANTKRVPGSKDQNGDISDSGSSSGVKRSRTSSTTNQNSTTVLSNSTNQSQNLLSQLNITLNCHYCWAQFQLNVTKNLKNSIQQKENGKYMQHLTMHLNAPYKCNECSYPITDTKTFFKHKQFYKHDEKTCIMVDNDISTTQSNNNQTRRKILIATRLRQHNAHQIQIKEEEKLLNELNESNEMQLYHDKDSFKCSLCYPDNDSTPMTAISSLNKTPTVSSLGASNLSFDKEQVLKHVLIVHLSFLAYKCDTCTQFYAFDEPQTKQHAGLVHHCGSNEGNTCHFKLIKTEEEINLAINRAQQFITKIPANRKTESSKNKNSNQIQTNSPIEAQPKYKCCKCNMNDSNQENENFNKPVVLYSYQDALDHVMNVHMASQPPGIKKDKKLNYELELFEQNLEDLLASETGIITTVSANQINQVIDEELDEDEIGDIADSYYYSQNSDLNEWSVIIDEQNQPQYSIFSNISPINRRKRFKTNSNQSINLPNEMDIKRNKKFYFKPYLIYKCQICLRKMDRFNPEHWINHDRAGDYKLCTGTDLKNFVYSQISCSKAHSVNGTSQMTKNYKNFTDFLHNYHQDSEPKIKENQETFKLLNCLICGLEIKFSFADILKHFQSEHEFNVFDESIKLKDLEIIQSLILNNMLQVNLGIYLKRRCFIKIPPNLVNPLVNEINVSRNDLIDRELKILNDIYREQIVEKQIVSWLNSEQFIRRSYNYNSYVCIICNSSKNSILEAHFNSKKAFNIPNNMIPSQNDSNRMQFFSEEMKTVVLTNHVLSHFNEYCYRCMSCKISWPDRTQLLKHAQECSNSQVVRTKTKYKLKANCRLQLKFYLLTYLDYWNEEKVVESKFYFDSLPKRNEVKQKCRVFMKNILLNKNFLLNECGRYDLNTIYLGQNLKMELKNENEIDSHKNIMKLEEQTKI